MTVAGACSCIGRAKPVVFDLASDVLAVLGGPGDVMTNDPSHGAGSGVQTKVKRPFRVAATPVREPTRRLTHDEGDGTCRGREERTLDHPSWRDEVPPRLRGHLYFQHVGMP